MKPAVFVSYSPPPLKEMYENLLKKSGKSKVAEIREYCKIASLQKSSECEHIIFTQF